MEYSLPAFDIEIDKKNSPPDYRDSDVSVVGKYIYNQMHITFLPSWSSSVAEEYINAKVISADKMLVLNLNHIHAYGHIYSEVLSELYAVDDKYSEYDCVVTMLSPLMNSVKEYFNLNFSKKIKFILYEEKQNKFLLKFNKLKIVNHRPNRYPTKAENVKKLKRAFHIRRPIIKKEKDLLLYCSRNSAKAGHGRKLTQENEDRIVEILKEHANKNNLEFYLLTGQESDGTTTSVPKQYELFSNAKLVVGPHGGVMSNLIFLDPNKAPRVIEFCPLARKNFNILFDGAISRFAKYQKIAYHLPPNIKTLSNQEILRILHKEESVIDLTELKMLLENE